MSLSQSKMLKVGFGLWKIPQDICADAVYEAIKAGYRHLDSACDYGNEVQVGQGIKRAIEEGICAREDLWITSKLWNTYHAKEHVQQAIERSLADLQLDYLDLYLIHFPIAHQYDIQVTAFSPLGALSYLELDMAGAAESVLEQSVVKAAAQRLGKTPAQVVLRWGVQRGNAIIPKTSRPERLAENLAIFDFELSQQEMDDINALNSNRRFNDPGHFCEEAFNTFYPIYD